MSNNNRLDFNTILREELLKDPEALAILHEAVKQIALIIAKRLSDHIIEDILIDAMNIPTPTTPKENKKIKSTGKPRDFSAMSPQNLRAHFYYRKKNNLPISPELDNALATTFPGYDKTTQTFSGRTKGTKKASIKQDIAKFPLYSKKTINGNYCLVFDDGTTTKNILTASKTPYELYMLDTQTKTAVIRKKSSTQNHVLYLINYATGKIFSDIPTGVESVSYIATTHDLYTKKSKNSSRHYLYFPSNGVATTHVISLPLGAKTLRPNETIIIDHTGQESKHSLLTLTPDIKETNILKHIITHPTNTDAAVDTTPKQDTTTQKTKSAPIRITDISHGNTTGHIRTPVDNNELVIKIEPIKTTLNGTYNNVYVNGKKILSNHFDTDVKLMFGGTLLAIHGIVTDNPSLPQKPIWQIYDTKLHSRISNIKQKFSGYNVHATNIRETSDGLRIELSNRATATINAERIKKEAGMKHFIMNSGHSK